MPGRKVKRKAGDETVDGHPGESEKEQPGNASKRTKVALDDFDIEEMSDPDEGFTESTPQPPADLEPVVEELLEKPSTFKEAADVAAPPPNLVVMDRRISLAKVATEGHSLYSLVRAWVSDDPQRHVQGLKRPQDAGLFLPRPDPLVPHSYERLQRRPVHVPKEQLLNTLYSVPASVLLQHHLVRMKLVRKWALRQRAYRYRRFQRRLQVLGLTFANLHDDEPARILFGVEDGHQDQDATATAENGK